ncbi:MAG: hypothetical protein JXQ73_12695 [Phycisphaerae bacterium]|nr:hypothetical protein [Phycisphaerae bacterium]
MTTSNLHKYVASYTCAWEDADESRRIIEAQAVDRAGFEFFARLQCADELVGLDDGRVECRRWFLSARGDLASESREIVYLPKAEWRENKVFLLKPSPEGPHRLGGERPAELVLPHLEQMKTPFHYIGSIDGTDPLFKWLGVPVLHVIWPMFELCFGVFLDCSDPNHPMVLNPESISQDWWVESMEGLGELVHEEARFVASDDLDIDFNPPSKYPGTPGDPLSPSDEETMHICGVPFWEQGADVPECPATGETMRCVVSIESDRRVKVKPGYRTSPFNNDYLCFGDVGHLYVFFHPRSRIMHVQMQCG